MENRNRKTITPPSGDVYIIRKVHGRELIDIEFPLLNPEDISSLSEEVQEEKLKLRWEKMTPTDKKKQYEFNNVLIILACMDPKVSQDLKEDLRWINDIDHEDYVYLVREINEFSFGGKLEKSPLEKS